MLKQFKNIKKINLKSIFFLIQTTITRALFVKGNDAT
jgi:hypothetical protein